MVFVAGWNWNASLCAPELPKVELLASRYTAPFGLATMPVDE
jgi:hypothetical protein